MEDTATKDLTRCDRCGCTTYEAIADARALGLEAEFRAGVYTCCEIDERADAEWRACLEAALSEESDYKREAEDYVIGWLSYNRPLNVVPYSDSIR